jgi:sigma-E factor negative regulatory protein RseA
MISGKQELLSVFVDEETSELEARRACRALLSDERELARWSRYFLIRDVVRGNLPAAIDPDFVTKVMTRIEGEPVHRADKRAGAWRDNLLRPTMGFGLAASIAALAALGLQSLTAPTPATAPPAVQVATEPSSSRQAVRRVDAESSAIAKPTNDFLARHPQVASRLNSYLINHSEYASSHDAMAYARVVAGYGASQ